jgi:hypothetical protein
MCSPPIRPSPRPPCWPARPEMGRGRPRLRPARRRRRPRTPPSSKAFCRARLAAYKVPSRFEFVADFPRTAAGKVQKHSRCLAAAGFRRRREDLGPPLAAAESRPFAETDPGEGLVAGGAGPCSASIRLRSILSTAALEVADQSSQEPATESERPRRSGRRPPRRRRLRSRRAPPPPMRVSAPSPPIRTSCAGAAEQDEVAVMDSAAVDADDWPAGSELPLTIRVAPAATLPLWRTSS